MKIVQIEDFFHPDAGYQINIISKYFSKFGHEVYILTAMLDAFPEKTKAFFGDEAIEQKDRNYSDKYDVSIIRLPVIGIVSHRVIFTNEIFKKIEHIHPDVVFIHNCDSYIGMKMLKRYKKGEVPGGLVMDSHMLKMASKNKLSRIFHLWYRLFYTPVIIHHDLKVIRVQDDDFVESELGIPIAQAPWISFGSDIMLFHPDGEVKERFKREVLGDKGSFVVVYAGKLVEEKGAMFFANAIKEKIASSKNVAFVIVGNTTGAYGEKLEAVFRSSENRILRYPTQVYEKLAYFFQIADLVVFPKQCSLSFYDAQACGAPVLSENNHINLDRCSHNNGDTFMSGDSGDFRKKISAFASMPDGSYNRISENAYRFVSGSYNYEDKSHEYEKYIIEAASDHKNRRG